MADELRVNVSLSFSKGGAKLSISKSGAITVTGDCFVHGVQAITDSEAEIAQLAALGNAGVAFMFNMGASTEGDIYVGFTDGGDDSKKPIIIPPGEFTLYRHNYAEVAAIYARTSTGTVNLYYAIIED